jgi:hypothetical protein
MSWMIVLPVGTIIGILFSSAFPDMASGINELVSPPLYSLGHALIDRVIDMTFPVLAN